jgi:hypothetical protein
MPDDVQDFNAFLTAAATPVVETPEIPALPEPEAVPVEVEAPEVAEDAALAAAETPETPEGEAAPEADEHKRSRAAEKRIADLVKERERLKGQVAALSQQKQNVPQPQAQIMDSTAPPDPAAYEDPIDYKVDLKLWERDQRTKAVEFQAKQKAIIAAHPELPELIESANALDAQGIPTANPTVVSLIRGSEAGAGADLWHYLLAHQDEAISIARLSPLQTAKAIGKIEAKLTAPAPTPAPKAGTPVKKPTLPAPIAPVKTVPGTRATSHEFTEY